MIIAIERTDGGVSIMHTAAGTDTEQEVAKWKEIWPGKYKSHGEIDAVPADRDSRGRWRLVDGRVTMPNTPTIKVTDAQRIADKLAEDPIAIATLTAALN